MQASRHLGRITAPRTGQTLSGRRGSSLVALLCAVAAGVLIYLFISQNRTTTVTTGPSTATVFVAKRYIPAGMPESAIISQNLLAPKVVPLGQAVAGAISDPSLIAGEVAATSIAAGQQVTGTDFSRANVTLGSYLSGDYRAVAMSIDSAHGLTAYLTRGDTVDVVAQGPKGSFDLFQDVTVLDNASGNIVLELTDKQVLLLANAKQAGLTLWLTLRPVSGARNSIPNGYMVKL